jgi:hypothetical protein
MTIRLAFAFDQAPPFDTVGFHQRRLLAEGDVPLGDSSARAVDIATCVDDGAPLQYALPRRWWVHNTFASGYDGGRLIIMRRVT